MGEVQKKALPDIFCDGARKGWNLAVNNIVPNVLMAFVLIHVLRVSGLLDILGDIFNPVMTLFALPGKGVMVLIGAWMSMGGGAGVAASLFVAKELDSTQVTILLPAIFLMGSQVQYMGRCLGTSGVQTKHYPMLFAISIFNAAVAMLVMRFFA